MEKFNKFVMAHPFLMIYVILIAVTILFHIPFFPWFLLMTLAYGIILYFVNLGTSLGWTAYFLEGFLRSKNKKSSLVSKMYEKAYSLNTQCGPALISYGLDNLREYHFPLALEIFQKVCDMPKLSPVFLKYAEEDLAIALWKNGHLDKAIEQMKMMEEKYEFFGEEFHSTFGFFYIAAGDYQKAVEYTDLALKDNENSAAAFDNLGQISFRLGDFEEAEKQFKRALSIKDTLADSKYYLGCIYEEYGDFEEAAQYFLLAKQSPLTGLNTLSPETIDAKYREYFGENAHADEITVNPFTYESEETESFKTTEPVVRDQTKEDDLDDIEQEIR